MLAPNALVDSEHILPAKFADQMSLAINKKHAHRLAGKMDVK